MKTYISHKCKDIVIKQKNKLLTCRMLDDGGFIINSKDGQYQCFSALKLLSIQLRYLCSRDNLEVDFDTIFNFINEKYVFLPKSDINDYEYTLMSYSDTISNLKRNISKYKVESKKNDKAISNLSQIIEDQQKEIDLLKKQINKKGWLKKILKLS